MAQTTQTSMHTKAWQADVTAYQDQSDWTPETAACLFVGLPVGYQPNSDNPKVPPVFNSPSAPETRHEKQYWAVLNGIQQAIDEGLLEVVDPLDTTIMISRPALIRFAQQQFTDLLVEPFKLAQGVQSMKQAQSQKSRFVANRDSSWLRMLIVFANNPEQYLHEKGPEKINMLQLHQDTQWWAETGRFPDKPDLQGYDGLLKQYKTLYDFSQQNNAND